jgi:hypothetical protein
MSRERCAEHDLAVGPGGECVLCRRARVRPVSGRPRWLAPALLAAGLATTLLGGVALARTRTAVPPVAQTATAEVIPPAAPHVEVSSVHAAVAQTHPYEPGAAYHPSPPPPAPPPRDYLGEAYAAMPKDHLYDEAPATPAPSVLACPCLQAGCQVRYSSYGGAVSYPPRAVSTAASAPGTSVRSMTSMSTVPVQQPAVPSSFSRFAGSRR